MYSGQSQLINRLHAIRRNNLKSKNNPIAHNVLLDYFLFSEVLKFFH